MNVPQGTPHGVIATTDDLTRTTLSRMARRGEAIRLAAGLYAVGATLPPEQVTRHHLHQIIATLWPGAVLCGRTALAGAVPVDGVVYIAHPTPPRSAKLGLPGLTIVPTIGPPALPGDMPLPQRLFMSGPARVLVENVDVRGRPGKWRAGSAAVEDRIDELARSGGADRIRSVLHQLDVIASSFDSSAVGAVRDRLAAVLGSFSGRFDAASSSRRLAARLAGVPFDGHRIDMIERLVVTLENHPPRPVPASPPSSRWEWVAFFEAYFSNFIEGTEFGVDEARRIAVDGVIPAARPADAHDVAATYRLAADASDRVRVPRSGDELVEILCDRHRTLMAARADKHPGQLKQIQNYAGGYQFVEPALVTGTLERGIDSMASLVDPFARGVAMMVLVTECHPFDDGNGRVARLTANAELSTAGQVRFCIPTSYRNEYLAALSGFSNGAGAGESLVAVLDFAQRWTAAVDWSSYDDAHLVLRNCNAYVDPEVADSTGRRLQMPRRTTSAR